MTGAPGPPDRADPDDGGDLPDSAHEDEQLPDRDRDPLGRPRNGRARDGLGRPLGRLDTGGVERVPDELLLAPSESLAAAQRLIDAGRPFHAHEVLEASWKAAPPEERDLWQGLAQIAVGLTHRARGNPAGACALLLRGAAKISPYADDAPHGIDVTGLVTAALALAGEVVVSGEAPRAVTLRG